MHGVDAAEHAAQLLALALEGAPLTPAELEAGAGTPFAELEGPLATLERHDLVQRDAAGTVRLGTRVLRFARLGGERDLTALAAPALQRLADESGETATLMVMSPGGGVEAVAQVDGPHLLAAGDWVGREVPVHTSAAGKLLLAFGVARLPPGALERRTPGTVVEPQALERELADVRARGYAIAVDELEVGLAALAAPVRASGDTVLAALSVSGPAARLTPQRLRLLAGVAVEQAHGLSAQLGYDIPLEDVLDDAARR